MEQMMAPPTQDQRFPGAGCHHLLPEFLLLGDIFHPPNMVNLKRSLPRFTVFALARIQSSHEFRMAEREYEHLGELIQVRGAWMWWVEVFEAKESRDTDLALFSDHERIAILRFEAFGQLGHARLVLVSQRFEQTCLPDIGQLVHLPSNS